MAKSFKDLTSGQRVSAIVALAASLVVVGAAERDLQRRSEDEVRGSKLVWRLVSLNALGALGYFRFGRRLAS